MKAVILAGGLGSRLSEETHLKPKPMVEIGGRPILWHLMKIFTCHGVTEFIICLGYKGYVVKEYFANYFLHTSDVTFDMRDNRMEVHEQHTEPWRVTLVDTGEHTMTGGRLKRVADHLRDEDSFCFTYGDGLADIDVGALLAFHKEQGTQATVTAVQTPGRFGALEIEENKTIAFAEKPRGDGAWINGGFFVLSPTVIDLIEGDTTVWEEYPLSELARSGELATAPIFQAHVKRARRFRVSVVKPRSASKDGACWQFRIRPPHGHGRVKQRSSETTTYEATKTDSQRVVTVEVRPAELRHPQARIREEVDRAAQDIARRHEIGVEDGDELALRRGEALGQGPGLEALAVVTVEVLNVVSRGGHPRAAPSGDLGRVVG